MKYDPLKHHRRSIRLKGYDYSQAGAYFITICTQNRECVFGTVVGGAVELLPVGETTRECWFEIPQHFPNVELDEFVVMPNHIHGIIVIAKIGNVAGNVVGAQYIEPLRDGHRDEQPDGHTTPQNENEHPQHQYQHIIPQSIGSIIRMYKAAVTRWCNENNYASFRWQRGYYEHIVRDERDLERIRAYIVNNPPNWESDEENPRNVK